MNHSNILLALNAVALLPDNAQWKNRFQVASSDGSKLYTIAQRKSDNSWGCGCPGWIYKKAGRPRGCTHLSSREAVLREFFCETPRATNVVCPVTPAPVVAPAPVVKTADQEYAEQFEAFMAA